jgi:hypothetical protein
MDKQTQEIIRVFVQNGIALQNAVNQYAHQAKIAIDKMESVLIALRKIQATEDSIQDELVRLRKESAQENLAIRRKLPKLKIVRRAKKKK